MIDHKKLKRFIASVKPGRQTEVENDIIALDTAFFENFNCLDCAKCCKDLGPRITNRDISLMATGLKLKEVDFIKKYIKIDEDGDSIFSSLPCPFLENDNYCKIYEFRPKACKEYPHTGKPGFFKNVPVFIKNIKTCPAVESILSDLIKPWKP